MNLNNVNFPFKGYMNLKHDFFTLKMLQIGESSVDVDMSSVISYPALLVECGRLLFHKVKDLKFDLIAGISHTAIPITSILSTMSGFPMIYSHDGIVDGIYKKGQKVLMMGNLIADDRLILDMIKILEGVGLEVSDVLVLLDKEQGGEKVLNDAGYNLHSIVDIYELLEFGKLHGRIYAWEYDNAIKYLKGG